MRSPGHWIEQKRATGLRSRRAGSPISEMAGVPASSVQGRREGGASGEPDSYRVICKGKILANGGDGL